MSTQLQDEVGRTADAATDQVDPQAISLPADLQQQLQSTLASLQDDRAVSRLWNKDATFWTNNEETKWLGWLDIGPPAPPNLAREQALPSQGRPAGFFQVL